MRLAAALVMAATALCACHDPPPPPRQLDASRPSVRDAAAPSQWQRARENAAVRGLVVGELVLLDLHRDDALFAERQNTAVGYHGRDRFVGLRLMSSGAQLTEVPIVDAALAGPGGSEIVAFVTTEGELRVWTARGMRTLDSGVARGMSISPDGRWVVYAKGTAPELDIYLARVDGAGTRAVAPHPAPDYLPTFTPEGDVIFTSGRDGHPALWRAGGDQLVRLTPAIAPDDVVGLRGLRSPAGPAPPSVGSAGIAFFDGSGVTVLDRRGGYRMRIDGAQRARWHGSQLALEMADGSAKIASFEVAP